MLWTRHLAKSIVDKIASSFRTSHHVARLRSFISSVILPSSPIVVEIPWATSGYPPWCWSLMAVVYKMTCMAGLRGYCTSGPYFWRLCAFSQKIKQLWTKYPMDLVRNVPRNSKSTVFFSRDHCCEVTVKNVWKSIFSMFWAINQ